jgi:hypothetical protein
MPLSIADLQAQLDSLKTACRQGATSIAYEGKTITYRSVAEMQAAIASLAELGLSIGKSIRVVADKGW